MDVASEYRYRDPVVGADDLVIGITQSGETADTLAAMRLARERGATVLAITNVMGSQATRDADSVLYTRAGLEIGVAATKTFTTQVAAMYLLGLWIAQTRGSLEPGADRRADRRAQAPARARSRRPWSRTSSAVRAIARSHHEQRFFLYLGRNIGPPGLPRGRAEAEGDLLHPHRRLRRRRDEARPDRPARRADAGRRGRDRQPGARQGALERRRGAGARRRRDRDRDRRRRRGRRGLPTRRSSSRPPTGSCSRSSPCCPLQLLAYHIARLNGLNVDQPRNLAKTVTVE